MGDEKYTAGADGAQCFYLIMSDWIWIEFGGQNHGNFLEKNDSKCTFNLKKLFQENWAYTKYHRMETMC